MGPRLLKCPKTYDLFHQIPYLFICETKVGKIMPHVI